MSRTVTLKIWNVDSVFTRYIKTSVEALVVPTNPIARDLGKMGPPHCLAGMTLFTPESCPKQTDATERPYRDAINHEAARRRSGHGY